MGRFIIKSTRQSTIYSFIQQSVHDLSVIHPSPLFIQPLIYPSKQTILNLIVYLPIHLSSKPENRLFTVYPFIHPFIQHSRICPSSLSSLELTIHDYSWEDCHKIYPSYLFIHPCQSTIYLFLQQSIHNLSMSCPSLYSSKQTILNPIIYLPIHPTG